MYQNRLDFSNVIYFYVISKVSYKVYRKIDEEFISGELLEKIG